MAKNSKKPKTARSNQQQPLAVLYNLDEGTDRGDSVRAVLADQAIRVRTIAIEQLGNPVGAVVGLPGFKMSAKPFAGEVPASEFMLLHNVSSNRMNTLLAAMRDANCSVGCKAQVTQHNRLWPFATLVENVSREHEAMQQAAFSE